MKRINAIIKQIKKANPVIIDVGSDHALLSTSLNERMNVKHIYNIEKNIGPFTKTITNTSQYSNITNIHADGLNFNIQERSVDYCVIAGMGGLNIINIMTNQNAKKCKKFILQPANNTSDLRRFLANNEYFIVYEEIVEDRGIYYDLIVVSKHEGIPIITQQDIFFGPYNLKHPSTNFYNMYKQLKQKIVNRNLNVLNRTYALQLNMINNL